MLSRHQADPRSETAARRELFPISHLGHQRGCYDLCPDNCILASKDVEAEPRSRWNAIIVLVSDDLEQRCRAIAALGGDNPELGHVPTDGIRQHRSLTNQKLPAAM